MAPPSRSDAGVCGAKFRAMLRCVESSGSSAACADKVGDFLACERAVLRAAAQHAVVSPSTPTAPPPSSPRASAADAPPSAAQKPFLVSSASLMSRMLVKQYDACASLVRTAARPHCVRDSQRFATRMLADFSLSVSAVSSRVSSSLSNLWRSLGADDSSPKPR